MNFKNKNVLITGGSSGIGKALLKKLVSENNILICGRNREKLDDCKREFPSIEIIALDISRKEQFTALTDKLKTDWGGKLDILINSAGIAHQVNFDNNTDIDFSDMEINFYGTINLTMKLLPFLKKSDTPKIVIISSILAISPHHSMPIYCASKAALRSFSKSLRYQLKWLKVFEVLPPLVDTPMANEINSNDKMNPDGVATIILKGIQTNKDEIYPGIASAIAKLHHFIPKQFEKRINQTL